jgi:hypothetical protein
MGAREVTLVTVGRDEREVRDLRSVADRLGGRSLHEARSVGGERPRQKETQVHRQEWRCDEKQMSCVAWDDKVG